MEKTIHKFFILSLTLLITGFNQMQAQGLDISDYVGTWTGQWVNNTFETQGDADMVVTADTAQQTIQMVLDLDGDVLGGGDPDSITISGTYTDAEINISTINSSFGDMIIIIDNEGNISGIAVNVPPEDIEKVDFAGVATPETMTLNYTVTFSASVGGGTAYGVITLNKVELSIDDFESDKIHNTFSLIQNYPNPFNPSTTITFDISEDANVKISIYDMTGRLIRELVNQPMTVGSKTINWDGKDDAGNSVGGGVYFYNLRVGDYNQTKKMVLIK